MKLLGTADSAAWRAEAEDIRFLLLWASVASSVVAKNSDRMRNDGYSGTIVISCVE